MDPVAPFVDQPLANGHGVEPSAEAITTLEHHHVAPVLLQDLRPRQTSSAGADHDDRPVDVGRTSDRHTIEERRLVCGFASERVLHGRRSLSTSTTAVPVSRVKGSQ